MTPKDTNIGSEQIVVEVNKIVSQFSTKLTLRQIYYQLVSKHLIQNKIGQYKRLSRILVQARHDQQVSWNSIEDRTREATGGDEDYKSPEDVFERAKDYLKECWEYYNLPFWKDQPKYVEIWFEKQALSGIFDKATEDYNVVQLACKGYSSHTMGYELAQRLEEGHVQGREVHIVYFGDHDPSGVDIYRFIKDMCNRFGLDIHFHRAGITSEQIEKYNIPPMMAKTSDSRYNGFVAEHGTDVVELDALDPDVLIQIVKDEIEERLDQDIREETQAEEEQKQNEIKDLVENYMKGGMDD